MQNDAAHDLGRAIGPHSARGQIEGSCLMGRGSALSEEFILDRGCLATDTLAKVGIPVIKDAPPVEMPPIEDPNPHGPCGANGLAEVAAIPTASAILNAIRAAIGVRPATSCYAGRVVAGLTGIGVQHSG